MSESQFDMFMLELGLDKTIFRHVDYEYKVVMLAELLINLNQWSPSPSGPTNDLRRKVVEAAVRQLPPPAPPLPPSPWLEELTATTAVDPEAWPHIKLQNALLRDGYAVERGRIREALPEEADLPSVDNEVQALLSKHKLSVPRGHFEQAVQAHVRGDWAAANAQIRSFLESLLDTFANKLMPPSSSVPPSGLASRETLFQQGLLYDHLNEWNASGKNFVKGVFKRLDPHGSHPGLSDQDDSTFRLHLVLIVTQLFLKRFDVPCRVS